MIVKETKLRAWGNSIGVVIPKEDALKENLKPDQKVRITVTLLEPVKVKDLYGKLKFSKSTDEIMTEIDNELDSKFFRK